MAEKKMVDVFSDVERETAMTANPAGFAVTELGAEDERIVTLAADMSNTVAEFIAKFPERYIECGIAETNSVSLAAGLASAGLIPYIYSMSPFGMLKTCEQWRTDVDYNHLPVRLVGRLSGLAMGYFGTSHYAVEDIAIARTRKGHGVEFMEKQPQAWHLGLLNEEQYADVVAEISARMELANG